VIGLFISNASGVNISKNNIIGSNWLEPLSTEDLWQINPNYSIYVRDADHVTFSGNIISKPGKYGKGSFFIDPTADKNTIDTKGILYNQKE